MSTALSWHRSSSVETSNSQAINISGSLHCCITSDKQVTTHCIGICVFRNAALSTDKNGAAALRTLVSRSANNKPRGQFDRRTTQLYCAEVRGARCANMLLMLRENVGRIQIPLAFALPRPLLQSIQHDADERLFAIRSLKRHKLFSGKLPLRFVRTRRALRNCTLHRSVNPLPILR